ncbi:tyrosine--tRNA ligase [Eubacterium saphenum ATCC 49989]|nr:tyrosine--tRNA ligase [Eubacterium saphenum ATCC 49989]
MFIIPDEVSKHENVFDVLKERGFIEQTTHEDEIRELLANQKIKFYIGFDPTADSLHVGHFMQIIIMMYMQKFGHTPIVLVGGGTGMVGDPSGRTDMRKMMTVETVREHCRKFEKLFERFIDFSDNKAIAINNADWLMNLNYIDFLREIGSQFSVNRMLSAECFKQRLKKGLSFLEFNYMLMQAYDFLVLYRNLDCKMQFGGDDQWSNILAGVDLVRRKEQGQVFGMTFSLLTNSQGKKMGKTASGALWLDANKTSAYEFYQYWRNVEDEDVKKCLKMLTFLPIEEIEAMTCEKGENINKAKEVLAYEVTKLVHGEEVAKNTETAVKAAFSGEGDLENLPTTVITEDEAKSGIGLIDLMKRAELISSNSEGFRLVKQGGVSIGDVKVEDGKRIITEGDFSDNSLVIKKGKKVYHRIVIE